MTRRNLLLILDDEDSPFSAVVDLPRLPPAASDKSPGHRHPFPDDPPSIPIAIIVLLTVLFFMAFFSLYLRCFSGPPPAPRVSPPSHSKGEEGADVDVVRSLPLVGYRGDGRQSDCPVCLTEFEEGETVKVIPRCRHVFHPDCLDAWLSSHASCPLCRTVQLLPL